MEVIWCRRMVLHCKSLNLLIFVVFSFFLLVSHKTKTSPTFSTGQISEAEQLAVQDKTNRHLNLRDYALEHSSKSDLVVMTLPMPRKGVVSAQLYLAWLETLSQGLPPFLFVRGNQTSVLTFYS